MTANKEALYAIIESMQKEIDELKAQLKQPAQEPMVTLNEYKKLQALVTSQGIRLMEYESEPEQEPVAYVMELTDFEPMYTSIDIIKEDLRNKAIKLYTHPHQWQGLTDDEVAFVVNDTENLFHLEDFARAIEQVLKEKNHD